MWIPLICYNALKYFLSVTYNKERIFRNLKKAVSAKNKKYQLRYQEILCSYHYYPPCLPLMNVTCQLGGFFHMLNRVFTVMV